ncbi:MAG: hypothetical protein JXB50_00925 [Spirochaetes bacterium]|nr:hypothetical protein [Spirochaetota bacterium]
MKFNYFDHKVIIKMEVNDLNHCDILIQGVVNGSYGDYAKIPYDLGLIRNY